jgi:hypothetical protein
MNLLMKKTKAATGLQSLACALATLVTLSSSAPADPPSTIPSDPSVLYGIPVSEFKQDGMRITVHDVGELKVVAVSSINPEKCLFLSYTKPSGEYSKTEIEEFLRQFAYSSGTEWQVLDRSLVDTNLRFFLTAPNHAREEFESRVVSSKGDTEAVRKSWSALAASEQAHVEARSLLNVLESQRQIWVTSDSRFLACWSLDGRSLGVGFLPNSQ